MLALLTKKTFSSKMTETEDLVEEELIRQLKDQRARTGLYPPWGAARHASVVRPTQIIA